MSNLNKRTIFKHFLYIFLFLLFYVLQNTPRLFEIFGGKPFWVIAMAVSVAIFEGEFVGGIYGAFAGLLCDTSSFSLFGFNGFLLCASCIGIGLLTLYLIQPHYPNAVLLTFAATFIIRALQFLFTYGIFGYEGISKIFIGQVLASSVLTAATAAVPYFTTKFLYNKLQKFKN